VTDHLASIVLARPTPAGWFVGFALSFGLLMVFFFATGYLLSSAASASGGTTFRSPGRSTLRTSRGGSASGTPARNC
jgi:hypothetical protein